MLDRDWNQKEVCAPQALKLLKGQRQNINWRDVEVGHIDTGITRHPAFGPWNGDLSPFMRVEDGLNLKEPGGLPFDPLDYSGVLAHPGHGTRTSSVLCGITAENDVGIAPGLPTIPYRAVNDVVLEDQASRRNVAAAIDDAVAAKFCELVSISLGFPRLPWASARFMGAAVDRAYDHGIIVVCAGGQYSDRVVYPAKFWRTIGVGGTTPAHRVWNKCKYEAGMAREWIDVWAPADRIWRANSRLDANGVVVPAQPGWGDGTSYATVHVAAAAAMWLAYHGPKIDRLYGAKPWQRVEAFRKLIGDTSEPVFGTYWPNAPRGILNIEKLLKANLPDPDTLLWESRKAANQHF